MLASTRPQSSLLPKSQEQPVAYISETWLDHTPVIATFIHTTNPYLDPFLPLLRGFSRTVCAPQYTYQDDPLHAPLFERLDSGDRGASGRYHRINQNC